MKKLYKYEEDFGRMGELEGLFVADEVDVEKVMGEETYWGEILGKHSEVIGNISKETVTMVSEDTEKILWLVLLMKGRATISGHNPVAQKLEEIAEEEEEEDFNADEGDDPEDEG